MVNQCLTSQSKETEKVLPRCPGRREVLDAAMAVQLVVARMHTTAFMLNQCTWSMATVLVLLVCKVLLHSQMDIRQATLLRHNKDQAVDVRNQCLLLTVATGAQRTSMAGCRCSPYRPNSTRPHTRMVRTLPFRGSTHHITTPINPPSPKSYANKWSTIFPSKILRGTFSCYATWIPKALSLLI